MPAYLLVVAHETPGGSPGTGRGGTDWARRYLEGISATVAPYGGRYLRLVRHRVELLEGDPLPGIGVALGEFPSYEAALAWYHSDAYRPLKELRQANGRTTILLLDGWPEGDDFEQYLERRRVEWRADDEAEQQGGAARA